MGVGFSGTEKHLLAEGVLSVPTGVPVSGARE